MKIPIDDNLCSNNQISSNCIRVEHEAAISIESVAQDMSITVDESSELPGYPSFNEHVVMPLPDPARDDTRMNALCANATSSSVNLVSRDKEFSTTQSRIASIGILSLPIDSLHCVASFLTPDEWCNGFGLTGKMSALHAREIVRRVRLHGFKCATEVVTAFKMGQLSDARELAAVYIASGVPIYARCLGHSYHTLCWRIQIEYQESVRTLLTPGDGTLSVPVGPDAFYVGRQDFRNREGFKNESSYVEEKCSYWAIGRSASLGPSNRRNTSDVFVGSNAQNRTPRSVHTSDVADSSSKSMPELSPAKFHVPIHQHLLDQHNRGVNSVNDLDGKMITPFVSLSADFYHPNAKRLKSLKRCCCLCSRIDATSSSGIYYSQSSVPTQQIQTEIRAEDEIGVMETIALGLNLIENNLLESVTGHRSVHDNRHLLGHGAFEAQELSRASRIQAALDSAEYDVYSSSRNLSSSNVHINGRLGSEVSSQHLRLRFATYQRRLEGFISESGNRSLAQFEECLLDFWDEFFPHTADIHYYDTETAVPRMSRLQKFLTKPCPQAIGVIQCEIERIRTSTRGKGVNMKGRLFPTYEYRLFIRNRPVSNISCNSSTENASQPDSNPVDEFVRRDSVLMVARNQGRKHAEDSGVVATSRKGANNYYLYMPKQSDVDDHFNNVNNDKSVSPSVKRQTRLQVNGLSNFPMLSSDDARSVLLGRLQSNFIGTEFQIFTPCLRKPTSNAKHNPSRSLFGQLLGSDDDDYDSGVSSDTTRRSRFSRLSLRRNQHPIPSPGIYSDVSENCAMSDSSSPYPADRRHPSNLISVRRTLSSPDLAQQGRQVRTKRRAIANSNDAGRVYSPSQLFHEEENGVITYTANLLGSRPRIMDVCIPKVTADGSCGLEWKKHVENSQEQYTESQDNSRMLSGFRQLQQRRENLENSIAGHGTDPVRHEGQDTENVNEGTNIVLPDDFGLLMLQNRPPWWNVELGSFVLNFGGRVSVASVKNFQLCERTDQDRIMLQFGRIQGRHSFTMDFQHPLTAVQAFSIAISSLQSKISFG